jgi:transcriptional regulator with XRE-family HTH domain
MKNVNFYNLVTYKKKQSETTRENWQKGIYKSLSKIEKRKCANPNCNKSFKVKQSSKKRFCSRSCAAKVNNPKRSKVNSYKKKEIERMYKSGLSMKEISKKLGCSTVAYWMKEIGIPRRNISDAVYQRLNPDGDPFYIKKNLSAKEQKLCGLGIGLYLGEGNRSNKYAVRLCNSDSRIIKLFRKFLIQICGIDQKKLKYNLLLFNDANKKKALNFWTRELGITKKQIGSVTSLKPRGEGTYKKKSMTGVLFIEFNNVKLRKEINNMIEIYYKINLPG